MGELLDSITAGWKDAMKSGDSARRDTLSGLRAALKSAEINARGAAAASAGADASAAELAVIEKEAKKRRESITAYQAGNRPELAQKEAAELAVIAEFLPAPLGPDELLVLVQGVIAEKGATGPRDMGAVMAQLVPQIGGRADGKQVSALVRQLLAG